jgi:hypothetical protein
LLLLVAVAVLITTQLHPLVLMVLVAVALFLDWVHLVLLGKVMLEVQVLIPEVDNNKDLVVAVVQEQLQQTLVMVLVAMVVRE